MALNKLENMTLGWQVLPEFRVVQHQRDEVVLHQIRSFFGFGKVTKNHGDRKEFRVRGSKNLNQLVAFFRCNKLRTPSKQVAFETFSKIVEIMDKGNHLTTEGLHEIAVLASKMN